MDIRSALQRVSGYSHVLGKQQPAQEHLRRIVSERPPEFPIGLRVRVSGSGQSLPLVPWIALLDPDVTKTATDGLYLVYLYNSAIDTVYLSMNQGATQHLRSAEERGLKGRAAERAAIEEIRGETELIRELAFPAIPRQAAQTANLGAPRFLPEAYEAGNIAALRYELTQLPTSEQLAIDLLEFTALYSSCVKIKDQLAANRLLATSARAAHERKVQPEATPIFKPKDAGEYLAAIKASTQRRSRQHEALIEQFGTAVQAAGFLVATNVHPRDMIVRDGESEWLVEAKTVGTNAETAVRAAIGQLFSYRHFYYRCRMAPDPRLLALFSAPIGAAFEELLQTLGIETLYRNGADWTGSASVSHLISPPS